MQLSRNKVLCFITRMDRVNTCLDACRAALSPEELDKASAFKFEKDQLLSLVARAQIRYLLSVFFGEPAHAFRFTATGTGKPRIIPGTPGAGAAFNISHTRGMVVTAFSLDCDVGVDVERLDRKVGLDIAGRFFAPAETAQLADAPESSRPGLFLKFWTLKEACAKASGQGLAMGLDSVCFDLSSGRIQYTWPGAPAPCPWQLFQFFPHPGTVAAVAAAAPCPVSAEIYHCIPFEGVRPLDVRVMSSQPESA